MNGNRIKVLVVEDSPIIQQLLVQLLTSDPRLEVVGTASSGAEAIQLLARTQPDVITMDVNMPKMDGFEATRRIMESSPVPVVIVSSVWKPDEVATRFGAVEAAAVAVVAKPGGPDHPQYSADAKRLLEAVVSMSEVRVVRRRSRSVVSRQPAATPVTTFRSEASIVAIGASTGGPTVLQTILAGIPEDFAAPLLIVQHISPGFVEGLAQWLMDSTGFPARVAEQRELAMPGQAYFAPDGHHLTIANDGRIVLTTAAPDNGLRPSVARLFLSVADAYGPRAAGVLLSGMGRDGADQLKLIRDRGGLTIVQDQESSLVFGMPAEAIKLNAAEHVLAPNGIAALLAIAVIKRQSNMF